MLTRRQETILKLIVDDYITTATPVASERIVRRHNLSVSPATVRNDVADLEEEGYVTRPHPSAGTVPSDKAYRFYVESFVFPQETALPAETRASIRRRLEEVERDVDEWANVAASVLAQLVGNMAIATFPKAREARVRDLHLVPLQEVLALLIVVLEKARLRRQLVRFSRPVTSTEMELAVNKVRSQVQGLTRWQIHRLSAEWSALEEELVQTTVDILEEEDRAAFQDHYVHGLRNLLEQPEFSETDRLRDVVEAIESGSLVEAVLSEALNVRAVRVIIGHENQGDLLWPLSVVICQYGVPDEAVGAICAIGPTRMHYSTAVAGVQFISSAMSDLVETVA